MEPYKRAESLIAKMFPTAKDIKVLRGGFVMVTFRGEQIARDAAHKMAPFVKSIRVAPGFDEGKATAMRQGRREDVPVWRVGGFMG
ncbi:MAG: hypothetical protein KGL39_42810 [Patescibacteria group bacterium]|nr:hypothetical protein [Patescibacteria group bacterium]